MRSWCLVYIWIRRTGFSGRESPFFSGKFKTKGRDQVIFFTSIILHAGTIVERDSVGNTDGVLPRVDHHPQAKHYALRRPER